MVNNSLQQTMKHKSFIALRWGSCKGFPIRFAFFVNYWHRCMSWLCEALMLWHKFKNLMTSLSLKNVNSQWHMTGGGAQ